MLGDIIHIKEEYYATATHIVAHLSQHPFFHREKIVVAIAGESGSGKSVTAVCLQELLNQNGKHTIILHLDDYFVLPPATNHAERIENIDHVGPTEVRMALLQLHIDGFLAGVETITKPVVNYKLNQILAETIITKPYDVLIVEGTYSLLLDHIQMGIFMDRTYIETKAQRDARGRDVQDPFVEEVLAIEHDIIRPTRSKAQLVVDKNYKVIVNG